MGITIIIPTINEPTLEQVVQSAKGELPDAEIIIVGYGPSEEVARRNSVKFLDLKQKTSKPIGINKAVKLARNDNLIVLDADAIPLPNWGENMHNAFKQGRQIFCGSVNISKGNLWMKVYNLSSFHEFVPENRSGTRKHLPAINMGFTRQAYEQGGIWDDTLARSQDYEWTLRLYEKGITPWFEPKPSILHIPDSQSTFIAVWNSWVKSGYYNWLIRNRYKHILNTPRILENPLLILVFSPFLSLIPTFRILRTSPGTFFRYVYLIPFVYLTKLAWCFGVYKASKNKQDFQKN